MSIDVCHDCEVIVEGHTETNESGDQVCPYCGELVSHLRDEP